MDDKNYYFIETICKVWYLLNSFYFCSNHTYPEQNTYIPSKSMNVLSKEVRIFDAINLTLSPIYGSGENCRLSQNV